MAAHVINEARRCLQCKKPLCRIKGCPIQTNIPEMIRLFLAGQTVARLSATTKTNAKATAFKASAKTVQRFKFPALKITFPISTSTR